MATELNVRVAGVTFEGRQELIARLDGSEPVRLVPEPDNAYDKNAIKVEVSKDGELLHIGYVPKELAAIIAPVLDGENLLVKIKHITGGFEQYNGRTASLGVMLGVEMEYPSTDIPF